MIRVFLLILSMSFVYGSSAQTNVSSAEQMIDSLLQMEKVLAANADVNESAVAAVSYLDTVEKLQKRYPKHPRCPEFLFRAGDVAVGLKKYERSLALWSMLIREYAGHELEARATFFTAFVLDSKVEDKVSAYEAYNTFLKSFPDHELAATAKMLQSQLGVSEEQLIEKFKQKN